ncbi:MAG: DUF2306 domain-containing protein [Micropepsaceae bacterium]
MIVADLVPIGWVHGFACLIALAAGAWNLAARKGTPSHRAAGIAYMLSMIVANLTVFAIYKFDIASFEPFKAGPNTFGIFHWLAVVTLVFLAIGWYAGARQHNAFWAFVHPAMMVLTYYLLLAGGINEAFLRVEVLRDLAAAGGTDQYGQPRLIGTTHAWWMAFVLLQLVYFSVRVVAWRWSARTEHKRAQRLGQAAA